MEDRPEEMNKPDKQDYETQHSQDMSKDGAIAITNSLNPAQDSKSRTANTNSEQSNKELGNYGPWMLVRKQPRKQAPVKNKGYSPRSTTPNRDRPIQGSRFDILKETEDQEDDHPKGDQASVPPLATNQEQHHESKSTPVAEPSKPIPKVTRICDPKAGKNSQQSQDKRKQQIMNSQKSSPIVKSNPAVTATSKQQQLSAVSNNVLVTEKVQDSPSTISNSSEAKRIQEQKMLQLMRIIAKEGGGQVNISKLQHDYMMALGSGNLEPKPPNIKHSARKGGYLSHI
ncbi:hypothetical protein SESBI_50481 [Sesbania bispinosa]|nr:hypothetical protein SESBI_50481 [Sesbania bispinosa]